MRTLNADALALQTRRLAGEKIPVIPLLFLDLTTPQRWAIAGTPLVWGGYTWEARDILLGEVEDSGSEYSGLRITLPGVSDSERALAFEDVEGAACELRLAYVDPDTAVVEDAVLVWAGELDVSGWQAGPEAIVHFTAEHRASIALRPRPSRYTNDEQQRLYTGDTSLDFDPQTDAAPVVWPAAGYFRS
ncbi:MAG: hypothetical protein RLZZ524_809 [Pseudomonadota bacterium]